MATTAVGSQASLLPSCAAHFSRTLHESCNPSSVSVRAALQSCKSFKPRPSSSLRASTASWSSASSSFQGRLCLVLTCPNGEWREKRRSGVRASLLGVGAPEALVIGVVALLVFGPKGLAEVARTLGKSLRAFQPTIKELQQVSREFKATLEQEIGLDEIRNPSPNDSLPKSRSRPNSVSSTPTSMPSTLEAPSSAPKTEDGPAQPKPYTTEDYVRITEDQTNAFVTEEQRKASAASAWGGSPPVENGAETSSEGQADTSADSSSNESSEPSQVGSTPTEPIGNPTGNGSPKP